LAIRNALRYFPASVHATLASEFSDELRCYGHIYMYRFLPPITMRFIHDSSLALSGSVGPLGPLFYHFELTIIYTSLVGRLKSGARSWVRIWLADKVSVSVSYPSDHEKQ